MEKSGTDDDLCPEIVLPNLHSNQCLRIGNLALILLHNERAKRAIFGD